MSCDMYNNCPVCNYSAPPEQIKTERKHFTSHSFRCSRCRYQTETKATSLDAQRAWNKSVMRARRDTGPEVFATEPKTLSPSQWPVGCHSPNSCQRNGRCMYVGCKHDGADIAALAALAVTSHDETGGQK